MATKNIEETVSSQDEIKEDKSDNFGCTHYRRNCQFVSPCCEKKYVCRLCHDEKENHKLNRREVVQIECLSCQKTQPVSQYCTREDCKIVFGNYFCGICRLYDNEDKQQFHCEGCGLCRVGGKEKYFHCDKCQMCLPNSVADTHKCIEEISQRDCPVCLEDIHTSRIVSHMPPCGHLIHTPCFNDLIKTGFFSCPTCGQSLAKMDSVWQKMDEEIANNPIGGGFANVVCTVLCKDCHQESKTPFHPLGLKCSPCGSYNTSKISQQIMHPPPDSEELE